MPAFGKLKAVWDEHFSKNPGLMLIQCGSVSSWTQRNIVRSIAFLGRPRRDIKLEEFTLLEGNQFWPARVRGPAAPPCRRSGAASHFPRAWTAARRAGRPGRSGRSARWRKGRRSPPHPVSRLQVEQRACAGS
jgi:hypothetical protein